ncbi:hypothetical protein [Thiomicrorhabdus aquaedulcis]|uniref:hypothetical protein n=1 Tax=Thiomicrorhabdus aquaedulcis TaxID=2211106 RepID=UPI000FD71254|nr:hypothetical protein [Thiomicrorhabdus aquaedulcis]
MDALYVYRKIVNSKIITGEAVIVDLVFGLPLVLSLAVVVYAMIYWSIKVAFIYLLPQAMVQLQEASTLVDSPTDEHEISTLEAQHGQAYWQKHTLNTDAALNSTPLKTPNNPTS